MAEFQWTDARTEAAELLASGELTYNQIAAKIGVTPRCLYDWRETPEFMTRVESHREEYRQFVRRRGIAILERRVNAQNDRWLRLQQLIEARAADPEMQKIPGGNTGVLVKQLKMIGAGPTAELVEEYAFDAAVFRELREIEKHASQELGQWTEKKEIAGADGGAINVKVTAPLDPNTLAQAVALLNRIESGQTEAGGGDAGPAPVVPA